MLLSRLRQWRRRAASRAAPSVPDGLRLYAIGDIHGRDDAFADLLQKIADDHASRDDGVRPVIILLGDLVDRGPHSRAVVERASQLHTVWPEVRLLMGNHEEVFLGALRGEPGMARYCLSIGGAATFDSYGIDGATACDLDRAELAAAVPDGHIAFLSSGEDVVVYGDYAFVHAGVRPGIPLPAQSPQDLRWIRNVFLRDRRDHGHIIVHGHSITPEVDERPNRIGIDTGAYASGILTAIALQGTQRWYLQSRCPPRQRAIEV